MKTIIGAGVLSLPYTISKLGYVLAIVIFVAVMGLSYFSTTLLIKVSPSSPR
jgi:amino acid permease